MDLPKVLLPKPPAANKIRRNSGRSTSSIDLPPKVLPFLLKSVPKELCRRESTTVYRYKISPGNNVRVILSSLRKRPWWHALSNASEKDGVVTDLLWEMYANSRRYVDSRYKRTLLNHLQNNNSLVSKKGLYFSLKSYFCSDDLAAVIPKTFYLVGTPSDCGSTSAGIDEREEFLFYNNSAATTIDRSIGDIRKQQPDSIVWILKPASKTNRGYGINVVKGAESVISFISKNDAISATGGTTSSSIQLKEFQKRAKRHGWIVQEYMTRPMLIAGRKFDIRCFVLITREKGKGLKAYFFRDAYVRTSSKAYSLDRLTDNEIHLTNDAIQKHSKSYGKFENGNKLSMEDWQESITRDYPTAPPHLVALKILPEIKKLTATSITAASSLLNQSTVDKSFELLGYDYMVDEDFNPFLIEVNSNPCLEFACPLLEDIISSLIENTFRVAVDPWYPPPHVAARTAATEEAVAAISRQPNKYELIIEIPRSSQEIAKS